MIDLGRAIQHPFEDKDWAVKMLVGAGISLVPILNFALSGYSLQVQRNVAQGQDVPLPRWDDMGKYLTDGLKVLVVQIIFAIPILVISFGLMVSGMLFGFSSDAMSRSMRDVAGAGFSVLSLALTCLIMLYGVAYVIIQPATLIQLARTDQISSVFRFSEIMAIIKNRTGDYILALFMPVILSFAISAVFGFINLIPFVGLCITFIFIPFMFLALPYISIVLGHIYGQLMRP